jgi:hypothetical protein
MSCTTEYESVVRQIWSKRANCTNGNDTAVLLNPGAVTVIGMVVRQHAALPPDSFPVAIGNQSLHYSVVLNGSEVQQETPRREAVRPCSIETTTETTAGVLVCKATSLSLPNQFFNIPMQLAVTLRQGSKQAKPFNHRQIPDHEEMNLRLLMDINRYRPQTGEEHTVHRSVQFVQPLCVDFHVRELSPAESILSVRVRNCMDDVSLTIHDVVFHQGRLRAQPLKAGTFARSERLNSGTGGHRSFSVVPMNSANAGTSILPQEEFTLIYNITPAGLQHESEDDVSDVQFISPCTVLYKLERGGLLHNGHATGVEVGTEGSLPDLETAIQRILLQAESALNGGYTELECTAAWTMGSTFCSAGKSTDYSPPGLHRAIRVAVSGPAMALVGETFVLRVCLTNTSEREIHGVILCAPPRWGLLVCFCFSM